MNLSKIFHGQTSQAREVAVKVVIALALINSTAWAQRTKVKKDSSRNAVTLPTKVEKGTQLFESTEVSHITKLWGITPPTSSDIRVERRTGTLLWDIYLIDGNVPLPNGNNATLSDWAICSAVFSVDAEFSKLDLQPLEINSATSGLFSPNTSNACPAPPAPMVVMAESVGQWLVNPNDASDMRAIESFMPIAIAAEIDQVAETFVPPISGTQAERAWMLASFLVSPPGPPPDDSGLGGSGVGIDNNCMEVSGKSFNSGLAMASIHCPHGNIILSESGMGPCEYQFWLDVQAAYFRRDAACASCRATYYTAMAAIASGCAVACIAAGPLYWGCALGCAGAELLGLSAALHQCIKGAYNSLLAEIYAARAKYSECCAQAESNCIPVMLERVFIPVSEGVQP